MNKLKGAIGAMVSYLLILLAVSAFNGEWAQLDYTSWNFWVFFVLTVLSQFVFALTREE